MLFPKATLVLSLGLMINTYVQVRRSGSYRTPIPLSCVTETGREGNERGSSVTENWTKSGRRKGKEREKGHGNEPGARESGDELNSGSGVQPLREPHRKLRQHHGNRGTAEVTAHVLRQQRVRRQVEPLHEASREVRLPRLVRPYLIVPKVLWLVVSPTSATTRTRRWGLRSHTSCSTQQRHHHHHHCPESLRIRHLAPCL